MDIRQIQYFVALYEEGSITKAAKRMHVVQPAISQQIKRLEANADVQLFERDPHGVTPNALAHRFYHHCIGVLTELEQARAVLSQGSSHLGGKLVVGSQASFNQYVMGQTLATFHQLCPDVAILARDGYRSDLIEWLIQGELDFALLSTTQDLLNMHTRMVSREDLVVVGHCETLGARDVLKGHELSAFKLILPSRHKSLRNLIDSQFGLHGLILQPRMEIDSLQSLLQLALRPGWLSIVPSTTVLPESFGNRLKSVQLIQPLIRRSVVATWPRHKELAPAVHVFMEVLFSTLSDVAGLELVNGDVL